jgi:hypothetical protein
MSNQVKIKEVVYNVFEEISSEERFLKAVKVVEDLESCIDVVKDHNKKDLTMEVVVTDDREFIFLSDLESKLVRIQIPGKLQEDSKEVPLTILMAAMEFKKILLTPYPLDQIMADKIISDFKPDQIIRSLLLAFKVIAEANLMQSGKNFFKTHKAVIDKFVETTCSGCPKRSECNITKIREELAND